MKLQKAIEHKLNQWNRQAEMFFCPHGQNGGTFQRELWANGETMVMPVSEHATIAHAIPFNRAVEISRNGYRVPQVTK